MVPQSKYLPAKLWPTNLCLSLISFLIESVICISPPIPLFCFSNLVNISLGNIYLPITALVDGALINDGFSITSLIIKFLLFIFFFY